MPPQSPNASRVRSPNSAGLPLSLFRMDRAMETHSFRSRMASLILVFSGSGRLIHKKTRESLLTGSIVSVPPAIPCQVHAGPDLHWALLQFDPIALGVGKWAIARTREFAAMFQALARGKTSGKSPVRSLRLIPKHFAGAAALVGEMERELAEKHPGWRDLAAGHFQHLVILLSRHAGSEMTISTDARTRVAKSIRLIESKYDEQMSLRELANICGLSERTFFRVFSQATGQTPLSYLKNFRIERASEQLRSSENSVTEIAFACGFDDSNFFAREFRNASGYTPTDYRRHWKI